MSLTARFPLNDAATYTMIPWAAFFLTSGVATIARPWTMLAAMMKFGQPSTVAEGRLLSSSLTRMYGARDLYAGIVTVAIWHRGDRVLLGWSFLAITMVAIVDGCAAMTQRVARADVMPHWISAGFLGGLGLRLAGWV